MRKSFIFFAGIAALVLGPGFVFADAPNGLSSCARAHIVSFRVPNSSQDFCKLPRSQVPPAIQKAIARIEGLHQKIAAYFGVSERELLGGGIQVSLESSPMGSLDSMENPPEIHLGVFPDWEGDSPAGDFIDESTYVHELGHFLVAEKKGPLSSYAKKIARYGVFSEQFPDSLALAITGSAQGAAGLPSCFARATREFGQADTYGRDFEFFTAAHVFRAWEACCQKESGDEESGDDSRLKTACKELDQASEDLPALPASRPLRPEDCATFPWNVDGCSVHQVGTPINSFLLDLGARLHQPDLRFYFDALARIKSAAPQAVFQAIRARLSPANQSVFDQLWKHYDLDVAMAIARQEAPAGAKEAR